MKKKFEKSLRGSLQKLPFKKRSKISARYKLSALATTPVCKFLTLGPIYSKKSPQMPLNPLQGGLVYRNVTKISFWNLQIFNMNGSGSGSKNDT